MKKYIMIIIIFLIGNIFASFEFDGWNPIDTATGGENLTLMSVDSFFTNPGIMAFFNHSHVLFNTARLYDIKELEGNSLIIVKPLGKLHFSMGINQFGSELYNERQLQIISAIRIGKNIGLGIKGKYMSLIMEDIGSASTWSMDFGLLYFVNYNLSIGTRFKNISQPTIGQEYIYRDIGIGLQYKFSSILKTYFNVITIIPPSFLSYSYGLSDLSDEEKENVENSIWDVDGYNQYLKNFGNKKTIKPDYHIGLSYKPFKFITFSGGLEFLNDHSLSYALGFIIKGSGITLSYAVKTHSELGITHYFAFGIGEKEQLGSLSIINGKININVASAEEIAGIPGIGIKTAKAIVKYRKTHGPFNSLEELTVIKRIGNKTIRHIKPYVYIEKNHSLITNTNRNKKTKPSILIDINSATKKQLMVLPRIGEKTAEKILEYRKLHHGFKKKEEIMNVTRIGKKTYSKIKDYITVGPYNPTVDQ